MADHPAQHGATHQPKADTHMPGAAPTYGLAPALYVVEPHDAPAPPQQMGVGDTGTAKVSFKDEAGGDIKIASVDWTSSTGSVTINPPEVSAPDQPPADPTIAKITAAAPGVAHLKATAVSEGGAPAEAAIEIMVIEKGKPVTGKIDLTVQAKSKTK